MTPQGILETILYAPDLGAIEHFCRDVLGMEPYAKREGRQVFYRCGDQMLLYFNPDATKVPPAPEAWLPVPPHGARGPGHACFSASAAEIVAGALQDTGRAIVVGERSHGKASVQSLYSIRNGDGIRQTTAMYTMPSGRTIDEVGVVPDVVVPVDDADYVKLRAQRRHGPYLEEDAFRREFGFDPIADLQRETAESILRSAILVGKFQEAHAI